MNVLLCIYGKKNPNNFTTLANPFFNKCLAHICLQIRFLDEKAKSGLLLVIQYFVHNVMNNGLKIYLNLKKKKR